MIRARTLLLACAAALAVTLALAGVASAGTVTVNSTADNVDFDGTVTDYAEGMGDNDDFCTLREAIQATNTDSDVNGADDCDYTGTAGVADTINFAGSGLTYPFTIVGGDMGEDGDLRGDLDIAAGPGLTIDGDGAMGMRSTIDAGNIDRVLHVLSGGPVTIDGTILKDGSDNTSGARGGGILNDGGNLTLTNSDVLSGLAEAGGGGIKTKGSVTTQITNSDLVGNQAVGASAATGGGIEVSGGGGGSLTLSNSEVKNGTAQSSASSAKGGGIYFAPSTSATLSVTDSRIVSNSATTTTAFPADGGGVYVNAPSGSAVSFTRALIKDNAATSPNIDDANADVQGGGVNLNGSGATFTDSWITGSQATTAGSAAEALGAGIYNTNSSGTVRVVGTTISANTLAFGASTDKLGAGIYNLGTLVLLNSTVDGNGQTGSGGGGGLKQDGGSATIVNSTFTGNDSGGGRNFDHSGGTLTIRGSASDTLGGDCQGSVTSGGFNVGSDDTCWNNVGGDIENATTDLGSLQDNGGPDAGGTTGGAAEPIPTVKPALATSDAIDNIAAGSCTDDSAGTLTADQRGSPRPMDGDGDSTDECDSGAVEVAACQGVEATSVGTNGNDTGMNVTGTAGDDVIAGGGGNDTIDGGDGSDKLCGNAGTDTIIGGPADADVDTYDGGDGSDELSYAGESDPVTADLGFGTATGSDVIPDAIITGTIENLRGGSDNDNLIGDTGDNNLRGGGGDDDLDGAGQGAGGDTADFTGAPAVTATLDQGGSATGDGTDDLTDIENLQGGANNDNLTGDGSANLIEGGAGTDTITGLGGMDDLRGEANNDSIFARDSVQDNVNCAGDAADSVEADAMGVDTIDPSCENVSFFVPPVTTPPATTPPATTPAAAGPTGQRAAALKKCKKKKGAARKKCKKKAQKLPV